MLTRQHLFFRTRCLLVALGTTVGAAALARALAAAALAPVATVDGTLVRICTAGLLGAATRPGRGPVARARPRRPR